MNILVCSKISIPAKDRTLPAWEYTRSLGHKVTIEHPDDTTERPDVVISMGVTIMEETFEAVKKWPGIPLFCYNWDCYEWVWTSPRPDEYDYRLYGELLRKATEVWVPSKCTAIRTQQWWPWVEEVRVILSSCPWWDHDDVSDKGYALCTLRKIPDPLWDSFERACIDLKIPYRLTDHGLTYEEYQDAVAGCRLLVSHFYEASTGGLTLMESYYHGKPCLLSDSKWHGGKDYMGDRAIYFNHESYDDFKNRLWETFNNPPKLDREDCRSWIMENFSDELMIDRMLERINAHLA